MRENSANGRLDSWKEIAAYLNRDVRTVIRWEQEKRLPVHRIPGGKRQGVFAYKHEIDTWLVSQSPDAISSATSGMSEAAEGSGNGQSAPAGVTAEASELDPRRAGTTDSLEAVEVGSRTEPRQVQPPSARLRTKKWRVALISSLALLLVVGVGSVLVTRSLARGSVHPLRIEHFEQLPDDGRCKSNLFTDGTNFYFNEFEVSREILVTQPVTGGPVRQIITPFADLNLQGISQDGRSLLVSSFEGAEVDRPLWIIPAQGGPGRRVGDVRCRAASWSPDNRRIACASGTTITVMDATGSNQHVVGPFQNLVYGLLWSPDGERLRFVVPDQGGKYVAWEVPVPSNREATQSTSYRLPWGDDCCGAWAWTPDGESFVYEKNVPKPALFVRSKADSLLRPSAEAILPLTLENGAWLMPGKSGKTLYVSTPGVPRGELLKFDREHKTFEAILHGLSANLISFSRDGQWMAYINDEDQSLWRSRIDGSEAIQLTPRPLRVELSAWSPDGRQIAFMARPSGSLWRIYLIGRDGGEFKEAAAASDDNQGAPTWSADGRKLAYGNVECQQTQSCWIRVMDLTTSTIEKLPNSHGFRTARWSPDGRYIAALVSETHELMLFDLRTQRWRVLAASVTGDNLNWSRDARFIYADSPQLEKPVIERFRVSDGQRATVVSLDALQKVPGQMVFWFGLSPDNSPILIHRLTCGEIYAMDWTDH